jgi:hypothetical protein
MSIKCEYGRRPEEFESHDCGDVLEVDEVDSACDFGWNQAVHIPSCDRRGLVDEGLP